MVAPNSKILSAACSKCGHQHAVRKWPDGRFTADACGPLEVARPMTTRRPSLFSAKPTTCDLGHNHPSKVEARVCREVHAEAPAGASVYRNARLPLWALPPTDAGLPHYCNVDFVITEGGEVSRLVDAKKGRRSRDWQRGRASVEASYGVKVEERS